MPILNGAFEYKPGHKDMVICVKCSKEFKYHHSTSSLKYHLKNSHAFSTSTGASTSSTDTDTNTKSDSPHTSTSSTSSAGAKRTFTQVHLDQFPPFSKITPTKQASLTNALAFWIAKDGRPISITEDEGLQDLIRVATGNSQYATPSRSTIKSRVDQLYAEFKTDVTEKLAKANHISLTCDYWSSMANENYLGMTAHFVNSDFELSNHVLDVSYSAERHTSENVAKHIKQLITDWKIENKVNAIVTDNAKNMVNAVTQLPFVHLGCAAHTLQLSVSKALKACDVDVLLSKVRKIVGHVRHSPANYNELKERQEECGETPEILVRRVKLSMFII